MKDFEGLRKTADLLKSHNNLLKACKEAMLCLTGENPEEWLISQSYEEAPYHFLWEVIVGAEAVEERRFIND